MFKSSLWLPAVSSPVISVSALNLEQAPASTILPPPPPPPPPPKMKYDIIKDILLDVKIRILCEYLCANGLFKS